MSNILGRGTTSPYMSKEEMKATIEAAKSQAFAEAQKALNESTPLAPNTESNGNSTVSKAGAGSVSESPAHSDYAAAQTPASSTASKASVASSPPATDSKVPQPSSTTGADAAKNTSPTNPAAATPSRDTLEPTRAPLGNVSQSTGQQSSSGQQSNAGDHLWQLDVGMAKDMANIASTTQVTTVRVESLGNPEAMTRELLVALKNAALANAHASGMDPASQAALASMTQKTVDNIPHLLVDSNNARGVKLFVPDPQATKPATTPDSHYLASESTRVHAAQELAHGPEWPHMMLEGLSKAGESWHAQFPSNEPLCNAMMSLYGREVSVLTSGASADAMTKLASLANAPLSLPAAGLLRTDDNLLASFSVQSTHIAAEGQVMVTLMDIPASIEAGREVYRSMEAEAFARVVYVLVVPDGRPALVVQREHEAELNTLGLIGCCLTSGGGGHARTQNPMRAAATRGSGGGGLLENRCVTCVRAQQLCQPRNM